MNKLRRARKRTDTDIPYEKSDVTMDLLEPQPSTSQAGTFYGKVPETFLLGEFPIYT